MRAVYRNLKFLVVRLSAPSTDSPLKRIQEPIAHFVHEPRRYIDPRNMHNQGLSRRPHLVGDDTRRATCLAPTCLTEYLCVAPTSPSAADSASPKPRLARAEASSSSTPSDSGSDSQGRTLIPRFNHGGHPEGGFGCDGGAKEYGVHWWLQATARV